MTLLRLAVFLSVLLSLLAATTAVGAVEIAADHPLATVGKQTITAAAFVQQVQLGMRQRFYHGRIPQEELDKFAEEVMQQMIERALLLQEAKRRKLQPDLKQIEGEIAGYDRQYAASERWQKEREQRIPLLRVNLEEQSLLKTLEATVRSVPVPNNQQIRDYYNKHPEKFTTPEKVRVSLILLRVEPSSPSTTWTGAMEEGRTLVTKLRNGADFSALAKLHSGDASAEKGGDLGYIHKGMLAEEAQQALDKLKAGEIADPIRLLQGIAILRLDARTPASLNPYSQVQERAKELLVRDSGDIAWQNLKSRLHDQAKITIDEQTMKALFTVSGEPHGDGERR